MNDNPMVEWVCLDGFSRYEISNQGQVRRRSDGCVLRGSYSPRGYLRVTLIDDQGVGRYLQVHRLVALAFLDRPEGDVEVAHLDGDPTNARLSNLAWVSHAENMSHQLVHGTRARGISHGQARLTEDDVREIRQRHKGGRTTDRDRSFILC